MLAIFVIAGRYSEKSQQGTFLKKRWYFQLSTENILTSILFVFSPISHLTKQSFKARKRNLLQAISSKARKSEVPGWGDVSTCSERSLVVHIPVWKVEKWACCRGASFRVKWNKIGQSHDFWRVYSFFVARVASFAPERSDTRPNRTNLFHKERLFNLKSCCRLQTLFRARTLPFGPRKLRSVLERVVCHLAAWSDNNCYVWCLKDLRVKIRD